jgi:hypothetical protein
VILFDPIFQGLAISLIFGALASTVLTLVVVPGLYFLLRRGEAGEAGAGPPSDGSEPGRSAPKERHPQEAGGEGKAAVAASANP